MSLHIEHLKSEIQKIASEKSIYKYDVYGSQKEENSASAKNKEPFSLTSSIRAFLILRVWNIKHQVGVTRTSNLTNEGLREAFDLAKSSSEFGSLENIYEFSNECQKEIQKIENKNEINKIATIQDLVKEVIAAEEKILNYSDKFKSVPYNKVSESISSRFYFNSDGAFKVENSQMSFCYFYPLAQEIEKKTRQSGQLEIAKNFSSLDVSGCAEKAIVKTKNHLDYAPIKNGKYTVIFSPEAFLDLINAFSNFMNAQNILDKKSLSHKESIGKQIANPEFCLLDSPLHPKNISSIYFDEEGTPTREVTIIENGILKSFIHSSYTAKVLESQLTGHAHIGSKVTVSPHYLHVKSNKKSSNTKNYLEENNLIYIESLSALHAGVNELQGSFSLPFDGFYINENKKISIEAATVAGDFLALLNDISYIHGEEVVTPNGVSPEIWVKELSITGL
ncbi:TldD/PmbA family protein [Fluviispira multicolorata]|uniref:TldD/PmbA family protein n=1 Tax=Fluviispira multicolorata TaxID=2654512 RepID=A0A833N608_9BACT|nr:TldD/PmbA family protein [Fluviispira multicolorata]KAB8029124.1 TldD/PmbA family protein [Fluviispira multicolorata]